MTGPLDQLEPRTGKNISKTSVFPFLRIVETIKIKVPNFKLSGFDFIEFNNRVSRTFDPALEAQRIKKVSYPSCFTNAQISMQFDESVVNDVAGGQSLSQSSGLSLSF